MQLLKDKILSEGEVHEGNILKVDGFLNHRIDIPFLKEVCHEFHRLFQNYDVNKVLTIEASGIAIATLVAEEFECPLIFAKKTKTKNIAGEVYTTKVMSYTHSKTYDVIVSKDFLGKGDNVLIIDDFLAIGNALNGLINLVTMSGASLVGCGVVIEKGFQHGGDDIRAAGINLQSLAIIDRMDAKSGEIVFREQT